MLHLKVTRCFIVLALFWYLPIGHAWSVTPEALAFPCMACHGPEGKSQGDIPALNGRSFEYLQSNLQAFKQRQRRGVIMNRIIRGYSDEQIEILARYFSALK
ncbi:MAG: c-type cytochrome [Gammaproteobacteria bacterium]|nr:c-type cytochrome [Gammaproteobacteria bacterium]MCF6230791.1 c-type cytochrome [Gammaproteobacteria bacterium]